VGAIVVISGPVGAGKTTVAKALADTAPPPAAFVEGDDFWFMLVKPDRPRHANFPIVMRAMFRAAAAMAAGGYEAILDFSMPPAFLKAAAVRVDDPVHLVVLKPTLEVCAARAANRAEGVIADYAPYRELYEMFDAEARHVIQNDDAPAADVAAAIREGLTADRFRFA